MCVCAAAAAGSRGGRVTRAARASREVARLQAHVGDSVYKIRDRGHRFIRQASIPMVPSANFVHKPFTSYGLRTRGGTPLGGVCRFLLGLMGAAIRQLNKFYTVARPRVAAQKLLCARVRAALGSERVRPALGLDGEFALS